MHKTLIIITMALVVGVTQALAQSDETPTTGPRMLSPAGEVVALDSLLGPQPIVINIWATWCGPCRDELPALAALHQWLEPRGGAVVLIAAEQSMPETINKYLHERIGVVDMDSYVDRAGLITAAFHVLSFPTTIILDGDGAVLDVVEGASAWNSPSMRDFVGQWLRPNP